MNIWTKISIIACTFFLSLLLPNLLNGQNPEFENHSIKDTTQLRSIIKQKIVDLETSNQFNEEEIYSILQSSLVLKDTLSFFDLSDGSEELYFRKNSLDQEAIVFLTACQKMLGTEDYRHGEFNNKLGNYYKRINFQIEALEAYFKSFEWHKKYENDGTSIPCGNIADIYIRNENYEKALKYIALANSYSVKMPNKNGRLYNMIYDYFMFGEVYCKLENYSKAEEYYEKSLATAREFNRDQTMIRALSESSDFFSKIGKYEYCEKLFEEGSKLLEKNKSLEGTTINSFILKKNQYYLNIGSIEKAANPKDLQFTNPDLQVKLLQYSADYYGQKKDIDNTILYYNKILAERERSERASKVNVLKSIEEKYINKELKEKNKALANEIEGRRKISLMILAVLGLISSLLFLQMANNRRHKKLNGLLKAKSDELISSNENLKKSNEELERFAYIASHDLKTPLQNIISFTDLLEKQLANNENKQVEQYLSYIKEGGTRLKNLITDTLEYSRISYSEKEDTRENVDLNLLLKDLKQSMLGYLNDHNASISQVGNLPTIESNKYSSIFILFQNFIENGIKYNKSEEPTIKIYAKENANSLSIFIEDNGIGISKEYHEKVFVLFSRLHNHDQYSGTGLGLSICKKIIDQHKGEIYINSTEGQGTTFEIKFPLDKIISENSSNKVLEVGLEVQHDIS